MPSFKLTINENGKLLTSKVIHKFPVLFGRGEQNHISFPKSTYMSKTHGSINYSDNQIIVMDLNSRNGIFVNGERVQNLKFSKFGRFAAGDFEFVIEEVSDSIEIPEVKRYTAPKGLINKAEVPVLQIKNKNSEAPSKPLKMEEPQKLNIQKVTVPEVKEEKLDHELTVVSNRLVKVSEKLKLEVDDDLSMLDRGDIALQAVLMWGKEIFDVRQFEPFDFVVVGNTMFDSIQLPSLKRKIKLGKNVNNTGKFSIPLGMKWRLQHNGYDLSSEQVVANNLAQVTEKSVKFKLSLEDVCTVDLGNETAIHFRYVEVPRPLISKTWIENKEIFAKAITISLAIHLIFSLISTFSAEKIDAPKVENVPPRFAKLILDPPKMLLAPPPPKVEEPKVEKKEEPAPPEKIEEKPIVKEPPKPEPIKKVEKDKPKEIKKKEVSKPLPEKQDEVVKKIPPNNEKSVVEKESPPKDSAQQMADSFSDMFSATPEPSTNKVNKPLKLEKNNSTGNIDKGVSVSGMVGSLKSKVGQIQANNGNTPSVGQQVGNVGYQSGGGGTVGKKQVKGGVLGTPKLEEPSIPQGITQDQVMAVVNKYISQIHRCYDRALMEDNNLAGRIEYEWNISPSGSVINAIVKRSEISNAEALNKCVLDVFLKMKFPSSKNGQPTVANIGFPFGKL